MTYEKLITAVEKLSTDLTPTAYQLLWHLIATAIDYGTNDIQVTSRALANRLQCSRQKVLEAAAELKAYVDVSTHPRTGHTFRLPAVWFSQARWISTAFDTVEKLPERSTNQAASGLESEPLAVQKPGHSGRTNDEYQAASGLETRPLRRTNDEYQAASGLETRPLFTQNQQLTGGENRGSKDPDPLIQLQDYGSIQHIACSKVLLPEQRADGMELLSAICTYHSQHAPADRETGAVPELIIARCLAVAPLRELLEELKKMRIHNVRAGRSYGWYPSVFCQRFKGIHPKIWAAALQHFAKLARQQPQANLDFSTQLTDELRQQMRRIS